MPHLVILYSGNLDAIVDMPALCRDAADAMLAVRDEAGAQVFPTGGTRVLAYPAPHFALADGGVAGRAVGSGKTGISSPGRPGHHRRAARPTRPADGHAPHRPDGAGRRRP